MPQSTQQPSTQQPPAAPQSVHDTEQSARANAALVAQYAALEKQELEELSHRANAVTARIAALQKQQAQQDPAQPPNADIAASQQRLQHYLAQARTALQRTDIQNAPKYMDKASAELAKLEKFIAQ